MDQGDTESRQASTDGLDVDNASSAEGEVRQESAGTQDAQEEIHSGDEPVSDGVSADAVSETPRPDSDTEPGPVEESPVEATAGEPEASGAVASTEPDSPPAPEADSPPAPEADSPPAPEADAADMRLEEPLEVGALVGPYLIERVLRSTPDEHTYLAVGIDVNGERASYFTLIERAVGGFSTNVVRLVSTHMQLRHPRLLVPRSYFTLNGRDYLVVENLIGEDGQVAQLVSAGGRLPTVNTLTAGVGLSDALSYMHRNGVAHLHISPDTVVIFNGRAYLSGLEQASYFDPENSASAALVARDANFLARTLAVIGDVPPEEVAGEDLAQDNLRRIAVYGAGDRFDTPAELANACGVALESVVRVLPNLMSDTPTGIMLEVGSATTVGRVRTQNQDACAAATFDVTDDQTQGMPVGIFLVADGMGGEARGELASRIAARFVLGEMAAEFALPSVTQPALDLDDLSSEDASPAPLKKKADEAGPFGAGFQDAEPGEVGEMSALTRMLVRAVERANQEVRELAEKLGKVTGTTLTAVAVQGQHAALAHLGDSRAYLLRGDMMVKLTEDHSLLARLQMLDHPILSEPDMFIPRNTLYRSLGQEEETVPDTLEFMLDPNDRILICSDGLWDELDAQVLAQTLAGSSNPRDCAEQLVRMANAAGGSDNSTALTIFVHSAVADADR